MEMKRPLSKFGTSSKTHLIKEGKEEKSKSKTKLKHNNIVFVNVRSILCSIKTY